MDYENGAPPYDDDWRSAAPPGAGRGPIAFAPALIRAYRYQWRDAAGFPRRQMLYSGHLFRKFLSCTFAPGGVGKSSLVLAEAVALASGKSFLGHRSPAGKLRVWYWNGEDPLEELERRVAAICLLYGVTAADLDGYLFLNSGRDCDIILAQTSRTGTTINTAVVDALRSTIEEEGIDLVCLDPFVSTHNVQENDNVAIAAVCKAISGIADTTDCAFELVHHVRKTGGAEVTVEDGRGASALLSACRSARVLNSMTREEATAARVKKPRGYFRVDNGKANLAPPPDGSEWFHLTSVSLGNGDSPHHDNSDFIGVVAPWKWPDMLQGVTVAHIIAVQQKVRDGSYRESPQAGDWVGKAVAEVVGLNLSDEGDKARVKAILKAWMASGMLVKELQKDESGKDRPYIRVGTWATLGSA